MALGALRVLVTGKRGKYPDDPALGKTVEVHLEHASDHAGISAFQTVNDITNAFGIDDDGLPHMDHCTARVALAHARLELLNREKERTEP
jgi:hypothetical protein